ncbi:MAG: prepilin-type N-terminal cleavage/methylation domain-containing protein [Phycisphaerales bacterium]|nr:prepilin-type N-terminal cleavage/methylation domain-containing protein [Phycisphaerales bacterium]
MNQRAARGFTLLELMIVVGIIIILATIGIGVSTTVLARSERQKMKDTFAILDAAVREWESSNGRPLSIGGPYSVTPQRAFDIWEINTAGAYMIVPLLDVLQKSQTSREMLARIPPDMIRVLPPGNLTGQWPGPGMPAPYGPNPGAVPITEAREIIDPWGLRIALCNPGRKVDRIDPIGTFMDPDGSVRSGDEQVRGMGGACDAGRIRFVSNGPDGQPATGGNPPAMTEANDPKVADNIFSYGGPQ